ncbi:MAG TPA: hypothetical protein DCP97_01860 [Ruminococcaceae bacterium]|nr:hypothetical protein [Oscillospiraceae bacterium]
MWRNRIAVYDKNMRRLCFITDAISINYNLKLNSLHTAEFSLMASSNNNQYCRPLNFVEIFDNNKRVELFRITPSILKKSSSEKVITYQCEHVLATLIDDILFKAHSVGNIGTNTAQAIRYILDRQTVKRWNLQECDFVNYYLYNWENENLLSALFSIANPLSNYIWRFDTTASWQLSLKRINTKQKGEVRYKKNMVGITKTTDPTNLTTRLYLLGYGEGDNQLGIKGNYIDSDTINQYGIISKIAVDRRFQNEQSLLEYGKCLLEELKRPAISYEVETIDTDEDIAVGDTIRIIDDEENISELMRITEISKTDISGRNELKYTISNKPRDIAQSIADLSDRQRISDLYSQGSVNIDSVSYCDNADSNNPAVMRFFISDKAVRINAVNFIYSLKAFRAYSKAAASGGGSTTTSSGGGGTSSSTASGGGTSDTTSVSMQSNITTNYATYGGSEQMTLENHYHYAVMPEHSHNFKVDSHTHRITLSPHTHDVSVPEHSHSIEYGIYQGSTANSAIIKVDGNIAGSILPDTNFDIAAFLSKDSEGKIQRGTWHTVEIIPNTLTRVEASLQNIVFINPKGGSDL